MTCRLLRRSYGMEDFFAPLVAKACLQVMPAGASTFNVDSVRVNKIIGGSFGMSTLVNGMVVPRDTEGQRHLHRTGLLFARRCNLSVVSRVTVRRYGEDHGERQNRCIQRGGGGHRDRKQRNGSDREQRPADELQPQRRAGYGSSAQYRRPAFLRVGAALTIPRVPCR
jgi:hypothetical protein